MKLSSAAISLLLAASAHYSEAFSPATNTFGVVRSSSPSSSSSSSTHSILTPTSSHRHSTTSTFLNLKPNSILTDTDNNNNNGPRPSTAISSISPDVIKENTTIQQQEQEADAIASEILSIDATKSATSSYLSKYKGESGASIIYSKLVEHGVDVVNGYSGGAVLPLLDQFHKDHPRHAEVASQGQDPPIRWITNSNENSAGHIAEGYAKSKTSNSSSTTNTSSTSTTAGVVIATSGPGVTNLITPLQDAICDGVPMVVLCGQAATNAPADAFQQAPAVDLTRPCTKWSYQIKSAVELPMVLDHAFFLATNGRPGPVFIDLPKDLQNQIIDDDLIDSYTSNAPIRHKGKEEELTTDADFMRFVPRYQGVNGQRTVKDHVLHLGQMDKGILYEVSNDEQSIQPIQSTDFDLQPGEDDLPCPEGLYQLDHQPSNTILKEPQEESNIRPRGELSSDSSMTKEVFDLIAAAKKPIIIAGQGCNDCPQELKAFAEALQIPVTTTLHGLGCFDERHDLALNMLGMHGHPTPNFMTQEADLIINVGSRFDDRITGRVGDFIPEAKQAAKEGRGGIIHVDIRLSENSKQVKPTYFVHSTGKKFLETMNDAIQRRNSMNDDSSSMASTTNTHEWLQRKNQLQTDFPVKVPKFPTETIQTTNKDGKAIELKRTRMSAQSVVAEINKQLLDANVMDNCLFSTGVGIHQMVTAQLLTWTSPRQMITSGSLGTMGVALGFVIGCKLANGHKMCIAIDGDGSFNMTFTELKTVAEQKIPIKIIILDNESQMMVEYWQKLFHEERYLAVTNTVNPNYSKLADSFGIKNLYCDSQEDLPQTIEKFLFEDPEEPVLMHVRIERTPCLPLVAPGKPLQEMILEDVICEGLDACAAPS